MFTKTGNPAGFDALRMAGSQRIEQRTVAFIEKQDAVNVVRTAIIRHQGAPEISNAGMKETLGAGFSALEINLGHLAKTRYGPPPGVFARAKYL